MLNRVFVRVMHRTAHAQNTVLGYHGGAMVCSSSIVEYMMLGDMADCAYSGEDA